MEKDVTLTLKERLNFEFLKDAAKVADADYWELLNEAFEEGRLSNNLDRVYQGLVPGFAFGQTRQAADEQRNVPSALRRRYDTDMTHVDDHRARSEHSFAKANRIWAQAVKTWDKKHVEKG